MTRQPTQPDPIDRALAALRSATPPEEMELRILTRLAQQPAPRLSVWSRLAPQTAWLRGAITGAAIATATCALLFYATRPHTRVPPADTNTVPLEHSPAATPVSMISRASTACNPDRVPHSSRGLTRDEWGEQSRVPHSSSAWVGSVTPSARAPRLIPASFAPSKPAPSAPLTAQERALIQFARTATPAELAALNPAAEEKADADREAAYQKFFAPSPELLAAQQAEEQAVNPANPATQQPNEVHN